MVVSTQPNLTAVDLALLRPGTATGVSTYVKTSSGYKMFMDGATRLDLESLLSLRRSGVDRVFVGTRDVEKLDAYATDYVVRSLTSPEVPLRENVQNIRASLLSLARAAQRDPSGAQIRQARSIFEATAQRVLDDPLILQLLAEAPDDRFSVESHMVNCSLLAIAAALQLGIGDHESLLKLSLGAFLHDIGYARLPISPELDHLDLGNEAGTLIRQHPLVGYDLLVESLALPYGVADCVRWHHERLDGEGYPDGLSRDDTPFAALLTSAVDLFDWLTSRTSGRRAHSWGDAVSMMQDHTFGRLDDKVSRALAIALSSWSKNQQEESDGESSLKRPPIKNEHASAGKTVLVADCQWEDVLAVKEALEAGGYATITASNGLSALEIFETENVAVIFTEIVMPSMSGLELLSRVRRIRPDIPIVIASEYRKLPGDGLKEQIGAAAYVDKPFSPGAIRTAVKIATAV